jgi:DNA-directed RNA polymerase specialized sigma24 family protein
VRDRSDHSPLETTGTRFPATDWTGIIDPSSGQAIQQELSTRYWKPIYCYLRSKGYSDEDAQDLTQGFFAEIVLDRGLSRNIDRSKGKFRTLLLTALNHYAISVARYEKRKKRRRYPPEAIHEWSHVGHPPTLSPEEAFDYGWASDLVTRTLHELETECCQDGMSRYWDVFSARLLRPILEGTDPPSLTEICTRYGVDNPATASNMMVTVKRRFKQLLKNHMRRFTESDEESQEEMQRLIDVFSRR